MRWRYTLGSLLTLITILSVIFGAWRIGFQNGFNAGREQANNFDQRLLVYTKSLEDELRKLQARQKGGGE